MFSLFDFDPRHFVSQGDKVLQIPQLVGQLAEDEEATRTPDALLSYHPCKLNTIGRCLMLRVREEGDKGEFALRSQGKTDLQMHDAHGLSRP